MKILDQLLAFIDRQGRQEEWLDGYATSGHEADEVVEGKDAFIAEQTEIIDRLMHVLDRIHRNHPSVNPWSYVPDDLREQLRMYV